jgi:hypothetical protein
MDCVLGAEDGVITIWFCFGVYFILINRRALRRVVKLRGFFELLSDGSGGGGIGG